MPSHFHAVKHGDGHVNASTQDHIGLIENSRVDKQEVDWQRFEQLKENMIPRRGGRNLTALATATTGASQDRAENFEKLLADSENDLDVHLDAWMAYISWVRDDAPTTNKSIEISLLQRVTNAYLDHKRFANDRRYLRLWMWYSDIFPLSHRPLVFSFLWSKKIGAEHGGFFEQWAKCLEKLGRWRDAGDIFAAGLARLQSGGEHAKNTATRLRKLRVAFDRRAAFGCVVEQDKTELQAQGLGWGASLDSEVGSNAGNVRVVMNPLTTKEANRLQRPVHSRGAIALPEVGCSTISGSANSLKRNWQMIEDPTGGDRNSHIENDPMVASTGDILFDGVSEWPKVLQTWADQQKENKGNVTELWKAEPVKMTSASIMARQAATHVTPLQICVDSDCEDESPVGPAAKVLKPFESLPAVVGRILESAPVVSSQVIIASSSTNSGLADVVPDGAANSLGVSQGSDGGATQHETFCVEEMRAMLWYQARVV